MGKAQIGLVLHALALFGLMLVAVPWLGTVLGPQYGYLASLVLYWAVFCIPVIRLHVWHQRDPQLFSEKLPWRDWWVLLLLFVQLIVIAIAAVFPHTAVLSVPGIWLAALVGFLNGPLEETAWRGGFLMVFADRPRLGFWLGWILFVLWHVPLTLAPGIVFEGGALALVGGAAGLGLFWAAIVWRTRSVFWVSVAHALTNAMTFWVLFDANGFVVS
jgi:membrane protease YdiL (CAAX protease family)